MSNGCIPSRIPLSNSPVPTKEQKSVRICFVRHGETKANRDRIAAGRMHSPLTELGIQQARTLGVALEHLSFQKCITSDMERAKHTAQLVSPSSDFDPEPRLKEMGKGAREGHPKVMTYEDALKERESYPGGQKRLPLLESEDQVWERVSSWLIELLKEIFIDDNKKSDGLHSILTITHAGIIRTLCSRLLPDQMPKGTDTSSVGENGSTQRHLSVPNCSVTVVSFSVPKNVDSLFSYIEGKSALEQVDIRLELLCWK